MERLPRQLSAYALPLPKPTAAELRPQPGRDVSPAADAGPRDMDVAAAQEAAGPARSVSCV